jgi:PGF-pre-PGF domain-containing protein
MVHDRRLMLMKSNIFIFILAVYLVLPAVHAASISISQSGADPNTVMKSTAFTVTVSGLSDSGSVSLILPTGFSTEENTTKTFGGSTTSVSWTTIIANQKLSAQTISATITTLGSPETVTTSSFDVILPPSIVTSVSLSSISEPSAGSLHSINLNIQNYGETIAKDVVVTLSLPSGFSLSSGIATQTISTISGGAGGSGESVGISWTVTADSPSTSTITITVVPSNADSKTDTISVTVTGETPPTTPGGPSITTPPRNTRRWTEMLRGVVHKMMISDREIGFRQISIEVNNNANNVSITITKLAGMPASIIHGITGNVYQYIEIDHDNLNNSNVKSASIMFNVTKEWMNTNNFSKANIYLFRYSNNAWERFTARVIGESTDEVEYEADVPGLSVFAIAGELELAATTTIPTVTTTTVPAISEEVSDYTIYIVAIGVVIILVLSYYFQKKPKKGKSKTA